jgi:hypothetical protein
MKKILLMAAVAMMATSVAYARLHTSERFLEQMRKARIEFAEKTGRPVEVPAVTVAPAPAASTQAYYLNGTPAPEQARGIVVQNSQKVLRR